jgi:hypothetical protein
MKNGRLAVFLIIAVLLSVVYGNIAHDSSQLTASIMAAVPIGFILGVIAYLASTRLFNK